MKVFKDGNRNYDEMERKYSKILGKIKESENHKVFDMFCKL